MRRQVFTVLMTVLLMGGLAYAQEQRGSLEGVVKDSQGGVLPGATIEATSATGVTLSTTTEASGIYRFPSLPPGTYKLTAKLSGFNEKFAEDVHVYLGQVKKVDFAL